MKVAWENCEGRLLDMLLSIAVDARVMLNMFL